MRKNEQKGSITIFAVLALVLVTECLCVLLEGARFWEMDKSARLQSELAVEAVFAGYCSPLWEEYHLLGCDVSDMESVLETYLNARTSRFEWRENLLEFQPKEFQVESYTLITDGNGKAYQNAVSNYMKDNILYEAAKVIYSQYEVISKILESDTSNEDVIDEALESLKDNTSEIIDESVKGETASNKNITKVGNTSGSGGTSKAGGTSESAAAEETTTEVSIHTLQEVKNLQNTGILELVVEDFESLSTKSFDSTMAVSERELSCGKSPKIEESEWIDRILLQQYLLTYLSCYGQEQENRALSYEIEYLIGGKDSDIENLKVIVDWLLLIRQSANMLYLLSDNVKMEAVSTLATIIAGASANPVIIKIVAAALTVAWAYGESILDIRGLLQGKRIPLLKSDELWTLQISGIGELMDGSLTAKESEVGLSYKDYLGILLLFCNDTTSVFRAMNVQEETVRLISGCSSFSMDQIMIRAEAGVTYEYRPVFQIFDSMSKWLNWDYEIRKNVSYQY